MGRAICVNGFHKKKIQYDNRDNISQVIYYDILGDQVLHSECYKYDDFSNLKSLSYKNTLGGYVDNKEGIAIISNQYNALGQLISVEYRNSDFDYAKTSNNYSRQINRYNSRNLLKSTEYYDYTNNCIGRYDYVYDNRDCIIEVNVTDFNAKQYYKSKQVVMVTKNNKQFVLASLHNWNLSLPIDGYVKNLLWLYVNRNIEVYDIESDKITDIPFSIEDNVSGQNIPISMHNHITELLKDLHNIKNI